MKNYIALERYNQYFYPMQDDSFEDLRHFVEFLSTDYRWYDNRLLEESLSFYNSSFVYHDFVAKFLYIGFSEWEVRTEISVPCDHAFPHFLSDKNSCKIDEQNFHEFIKKWLELKKSNNLFALVYRDENDWILCQSFNNQESMEQFVADHTKKD